MDEAERMKPGVRSKVEQAFAVLRLKFGFAKVRYRIHRCPAVHTPNLTFDSFLEQSLSRVISGPDDLHCGLLEQSEPESL